MFNRLKAFKKYTVLCFSLSNSKIKSFFFLSIFLGFFIAIIELIFIRVLQSFLASFNILELNQEFPSFLKDPIMVSGLLLLVAIFRSGVEGTKIYLSRYSMQLFATNLRERVLGLAFNKYVTVSSKKVISVFTDEIIRSSTSLLNLTSLLINSGTAISCFLILLYFSWQETLFCCLAILLLQMPVFLLGKSTSKIGKTLSKEWENTNETLTNGLRNSFYLKVYGLIKEENEKATNFLKHYLSNYKFSFKLYSLNASLPASLGILVIVLLVFGRKYYFTGATNEELLSFIYIFMRFGQNVSLGLGVSNDFVINSQSSEKIKNWFSVTEKEIASLEGNYQKLIRNEKTIDSLQEIESVACKNLHFSYNDNELILNNLNFSLKKGDCLVVTGPSGSGKSTLLSLLIGMNFPNQGTILINGESILSYMPSEKAYQSYLGKVAYVGPYPYLIEGNVLNNLLYGNPNHSNITEDQIWEALKISEIHHVINELPQKLNTPLNEQATSLSVGQKQRLMIARALLREAKLLILDECTSNLDLEVERTIIDNLKKNINDKIVIAVTHREKVKELSTQLIDLSR